MRFGCLTILLTILTFLVLVPSSASAQYPTAFLTISQAEVQLGDNVNFEWGCPSQLLSWQYAPLPFIYAQITVNRVQEFPISIAPYASPLLLSVGGTLAYTPPTNGTFTVMLRCNYLGTPIGLGDFSCRSMMCKGGGQFVVTPPSTLTS